MVSSGLFFSYVAVTYALHLVSGQTQHFFSSPNLSPPDLLVQTNNVALADDGYIFITPYEDNQPSPLIFRSDGTLIWDGFDQVNPNNAYDLNVCSYQGSPHLCFIDASELNGFGKGNGVILDSTYYEVNTVSSGEGAPLLDRHEFNVVDNGTSVLVTVYNAVQYNASVFAPAVIWIQTGIFQEIDIATKNIKFSWDALDHIDVTQGYVLPGTTDISGNGLSSTTAWDYFHINSVDKTAEGDYIVSASHVKAIFKISGKDGSVIWQLGGKHSSFTMDYEFNFQYDARIRIDNGNTMTISLFDNGSDDSPPPPGQTKAGYEPYSSGLVVEVDQVAMTSTLLERYISPGKQLSTSGGNLQWLPNGNTFMGMGTVPYLIEFTDNSTSDAQVAFYANFTTGINYCSFKFPWTAQPHLPPLLFTYAEDCQASTIFYASWNGATEVASWRFATSASRNGFFGTLGQVPKSGFETMALFGSDSSTPWAVVEALDANGNVLRSSDPVLTFIPATSLLPNCSFTSCGTTIDYTTAPRRFCPS